MSKKQIQIKSNTTLFIDRDGVINKEKKGHYILNCNEFTFMDGVLEALKICTHFFENIVVVTNQRGIGRGLMTVEDLTTIHNNMIDEIKKNGGRIDAVYFCPDDDNTSPNRKPNAGMAFNAVKDLPAISLQQAFMVGNKMSDMQFARNAGVQAVFVATTNPEVLFPHENIDYRFDDLLGFAKALIKS